MISTAIVSLFLFSGAPDPHQQVEPSAAATDFANVVFPPEQLEITKAYIIQTNQRRFEERAKAAGTTPAEMPPFFVAALRRMLDASLPYDEFHLHVAQQADAKFAADKLANAAAILRRPLKEALADAKARAFYEGPVAEFAGDVATLVQPLLEQKVTEEFVPRFQAFLASLKQGETRD